MFAGALLVTTLAIVIPSLPFRLGLFEFYRLSWFHLYIAAGSASVAVALAGSRGTSATLLAGGAAIVLLLPLAQQIVIGARVPGGTIERLDSIIEMRPLAPMLLTGRGRAGPREDVFAAPVPDAGHRALLCVARLAGARNAAPVVLDLVPLRADLDAHANADALLRLVCNVSAVADHRAELQCALGAATQAGPAARRRSCFCSHTGCRCATSWSRHPPAAIRPSVRCGRPRGTAQSCAKEPGIVLADNDAGTSSATTRNAR